MIKTQMEVQCKKHTSFWMRQEYKSIKDKFEKPFSLTLENLGLDNSLKTELKLMQNYKGLGCTVWDGSIVLTKLFEHDTDLRKHLMQSRVVELGAGCGLVGIALVHLGTKFVMMTDMEVCLQTLRENVKHNCQKFKNIEVKSYVWGDDIGSLVEEHGQFDVIVAAEVLYDENSSRLLALSAQKLLAKDGMMFVSMGRNRNGQGIFKDVMVKHGYGIEDVGIILSICSNSSLIINL